MTREERIDWLCRLRADLNNGVIFTPWNKEFTEALTGILEYEPTETWSIKDVADTFERHGLITEQEPSGDLISRQDAIKAIDEKAKRIKNEDTLNGLAGAVGILFDLSPVNPQESKYCDRNICMANEYNSVGCEECEVTKSQEPCEDCISRQAAKKALEDRFMEMQKRHSVNKYETNFCLNTILELPSVKPQPKTGHWIKVSDGYGDNAYICECSECKDTVWVYKDADRKWNFCPNCGAKMD